MQIDKAEKRVLIITFCLIGLFVFSLLYAKSKYNSDVPECLPYDKAYSEPQVKKIDEKTWQVFAVASMWQFQPAEIFIPVGSEVDFFSYLQRCCTRFQHFAKECEHDGRLWCIE